RSPGERDDLAFGDRRVSPRSIVPARRGTSGSSGGADPVASWTCRFATVRADLRHCARATGGRARRSIGTVAMNVLGWVILALTLLDCAGGVWKARERASARPADEAAPSKPSDEAAPSKPSDEAAPSQPTG